MLKIGITGGIGSGKSTVTKLFKDYQIPVFYSDLIAKEVINNERFVKLMLQKYFGEDIYDNEGNVDRKKLAEIIFNNQSSLKIVNSAIHPWVQKKFDAWVEENNSAAYVIKEAAIMIEAGTYKDLDYVISVLSPEHLRIKRIMERDNISEEKVKLRMQNQISDKERFEKSHFIILNDQQHMLPPQVLNLHRTFLGLNELKMNKKPITTRSRRS